MTEDSFHQDALTAGEDKHPLPFFLLFRATPKACGGSQARGRIGATAAGLCHGHNNTGSEPHL